MSLRGCHAWPLQVVKKVIKFTFFHVTILTFIHSVSLITWSSDLVVSMIEGWIIGTLTSFFFCRSYPELDKEERVCWSFLKQLLQTSFLLREFVIDLPDVHSLQIRVRVCWVWLTNVHKQVLVELLRSEQRAISGLMQQRESYHIALKTLLNNKKHITQSEQLNS